MSDGKRKNMLHLYASDRELEQIHKRMAETGVISLSAYLRRMALEGYIVHLDMSELRELTRLLGICSNNLNQYVRRANESGSIYATDIEDLRERLNGIREQVKTIIQHFSNLS